MSETDTLTACNIEAQAAVWFDQRHLWDWDAGKQRQLDAWLSEDTAHLVAYLRLESTWMRIERLNALKRAVPMRDAEPKDGRRRFPIIRIAAAALVLIAAGALVTQLGSSSHEKVYTTPVGARETLSFSDGSHIELNTNSILRTDISQDKRIAVLEQGEAFFEIKHDQNKPFVVTIGKSRLIDLGTKFAVRRNGDQLNVVLTDGSVEFQADTLAGTRTVVLTPGETALATPQGLKVTRVRPDDLERTLSWRRGILMFQHTTLAHAVAEFNRYNEQKIVIDQDRIGRLTINGSFPANDVGPFIEVAKAVFGLRAKKRNEDVVLTR